MAERPLVLRDRNILFIWLGQALSQAGTRMYQIALLWWLVTKSEAPGQAAGVFMVMGALPSLLFVSLSGRVIDKSPTRSVLVSADLAGALIIAGVGFLHWTGGLGILTASAAAFAIATVQAFFDPALNKAVGELAKGDDLQEAIAFQSSTQALASFGGAVAGAALIDWIGLPGVIAINAGSFLVSAVLNALLDFPGKRPAGSPGEAASADADESAWQFLKRAPRLRKVLFGFGCANFFIQPVLIVLPLYVKHALAGTAALLGVLEASLWCGILVGTLALSRIRVTENAVLIGAVCLAAMAAALGLPGLITNRVLMMAALFAAGAALGVNNVRFVAMFQQVVPEEIKGRFFAALQALIGFSYPAAFLAFGALADAFGARRVCLIQGAGLIVLAWQFKRWSKEPVLP